MLTYSSSSISSIDSNFWKQDLIFKLTNNCIILNRIFLPGKSFWQFIWRKSKLGWIWIPAWEWHYGQAQLLIDDSLEWNFLSLWRKKIFHEFDKKDHFEIIRIHIFSKLKNIFTYIFYQHDIFHQTFCKTSVSKLFNKQSMIYYL